MSDHTPDGYVKIDGVLEPIQSRDFWDKAFANEPSALCEIAEEEEIRQRGQMIERATDAIRRSFTDLHKKIGDRPWVELDTNACGYAGPGDECFYFSGTYFDRYRVEGLKVVGYNRDREQDGTDSVFGCLATVEVYEPAEGEPLWSAAKERYWRFRPEPWSWFRVPLADVKRRL